MIRINSHIDNSDRCVALKPKNFLEIFDGDVVESLRGGNTVILDLSGLGGTERMRIVDFMTGVAAGLKGRVKKVDDCSYVFRADSSERSGVI